MSTVRMAVKSADRSAPRCSDWLRATMDLATPSSTPWVLFTVSDISVYQSWGACWA